MQKVLAVVTLLLLNAGAAHAAVIYRVQQFTAGALNFDTTLTLPGFVTVDTSFPVNSLAVAVNSAGFTTERFIANNMAPQGAFANCTAFGLATIPCDTVRLDASSGTSFFSLPLGTFSTPGSYAQTIGLFNFTLAITDTAASVPEPAGLALLASGCLGLALLRRRAERL